VTSVYDEQIYVDVDPAKYDSVKAGFAVGMNVNMEAAKAAILKHQNVLKSVQAESKKEQEAYVSQPRRRGSRRSRGYRADQKRQESRLRVEEERANNNNEYYYNYSSHGSHH